MLPGILQKFSFCRKFRFCRNFWIIYLVPGTWNLSCAVKDITRKFQKNRKFPQNQTTNSPPHRLLGPVLYQVSQGSSNTKIDADYTGNQQRYNFADHKDPRAQAVIKALAEYWELMWTHSKIETCVTTMETPIYHLPRQPFFVSISVVFLLSKKVGYRTLRYERFLVVRSVQYSSNQKPEADCYWGKGFMMT